LIRKYNEFYEYLMEHKLGNPKINRAEATYINVIDLDDKSDQNGDIENILKWWNPVKDHFSVPIFGLIPAVNTTFPDPKRLLRNCMCKLAQVRMPIKIANCK
jgi:hypothetical protein